MKSFSIAAHGHTSLTKHALGDKHKARTPSTSQSKVAQFFVTSTAPSTTSATKSGENSFSSSVKEFFTSEAVTDAEILWVLNLVIHKYSINLCRHINELLAAMFKDSKIS